MTIAPDRTPNQRYFLNRIRAELEERNVAESTQGYIKDQSPHST